MEKVEKFVLPAMAAAAVIGIWLALRKPAAPGGVVSGTGEVTPSYSQIFGTQQAPVVSPGTQSQAIAPLQVGAGGSGTSFTYIEAAGANFYANNPVNQTDPTSAPASMTNLPIMQPSAYVQVAQPPMQSLTKMVTLRVFQPPSEHGKNGGCSSGCGGCSGKQQQSCTARGQSNRFVDGRGQCLTAGQPKIQGLEDARYTLDAYQNLYGNFGVPAWNHPPAAGVPVS